MELFALYLWLKLDVLSNAAFFVGFAALIVGGFSFPVCVDEGAMIEKAGRTVRRWCAPLLLGLPIAFLLPSQKDAAILAGAHFALQAAASPEGQKVQGLLRARINAYLDEQLTAAQAKGGK